MISNVTIPHGGAFYALLSLGLLAWRRERSLSPAYVALGLASVPGIFLAVQGAEPAEFATASAVVLGGEILRRVLGRQRAPGTR